MVYLVVKLLYQTKDWNVPREAMLIKSIHLLISTDFYIIFNN